MIISAKQMLRQPVLLLALGFGSGLSPWMPGTMGSLVALPLFLLIAGCPLWLYAGFVLVATVVGCWLCGQAAKTLGVHDHPGIVWDEIVGMLIALWPVLLVGTGWGIWDLLVGFLLFRVFDIIKPWPIAWIDRRVEGGLGIMLDDIVAGVMAAVGMGLWLYVTKGG